MNGSYSSDPNKVAEHAGYVIDEFDKEGILSVFKAFPRAWQLDN